MNNMIFLELSDTSSLVVTTGRIIGATVIGEKLETHRLKQIAIVPEFWTHKWHRIQFKLVVDEFEVNYTGK